MPSRIIDIIAVQQHSTSVLRAVKLVCRLSVLSLLNTLSMPSTGLDFAMNPLLIQWQLEQSIFECRLFHRIDNYGSIEFYHQAGEDLVFLLKPIRQMMKPGKAAVHIEPPSWRPSHYSEALGLMDIPEFKDERYPRTSAFQANQMMSGLRQGLQPTITRRAYFDDKIPIRIKVNPAQFANFYPAYLECAGQLLPVNYDQIKRSKILYKSGQKGMSPTDEKWMAKVALYVNNDPKITAIYIDGHSDNVGRRYHNRRLSETRAFAVNEFFIKQGVNEDLITVRYHGDRYPIANNRTNAGRMQNRRVTVRVEREDMALEPDVIDNEKSNEDNKASGRPVLETLEKDSKAEAQKNVVPSISPLSEDTDTTSEAKTEADSATEGEPAPALAPLGD